MTQGAVDTSCVAVPDWNVALIEMFNLCCVEATEITHIWNYTQYAAYINLTRAELLLNSAKLNSALYRNTTVYISAIIV